MRPDDMFDIRLLKRPHKFFAYWIGRPDSHIMDWAGCNFHWVRAEGQPKGGFDTPWDAWLWADKRQVLKKQEIQDEIEDKSGSHKSDGKEYFVASLSFREDRVEFRVKCPLSCDEHDRVYYDPPEEWVKEYRKWLDERRLIWKKERACRMRREGYDVAYIAKTLDQPRAKVSKWTKEFERLKLEYLENPVLLTRIKRSYSHVRKRMWSEKAVTTNLFTFEYVACSNIEVEQRHLWNFCLKVTVAATGEKLVITQRFIFGQDDWTLYRLKGVK